LVKDTKFQLQISVFPKMYLTGIIKDCQFGEIIFPSLAVLVGLKKYPGYKDEKTFDLIGLVCFIIVGLVG